MTSKTDWTEFLRGNVWQYEVVAFIATLAAMLAVGVVVTHALNPLLGLDPQALETALKVVAFGGLNVLILGIFQVIWIFVVSLVRWLENGRRFSAEVWHGPAAVLVLGECVLYACL